MSNSVTDGISISTPCSCVREMIAAAQQGTVMRICIRNFLNEINCDVQCSLDLSLITNTSGMMGARHYPKQAHAQGHSASRTPAIRV